MKLPKDALFDKDGKRPCYGFINGRCTRGDACPYGHVQESEESKAKCIKDKKKMAERAEKKKAAAAAANNANGAQQPPVQEPKAKAAAKKQA